MRHNRDEQASDVCIAFSQRQESDTTASAPSQGFHGRMTKHNADAVSLTPGEAQMKLGRLLEFRL
jgi:hypothetical protein